MLGDGFVWNNSHECWVDANGDLIENGAELSFSVCRLSVQNNNLSIEGSLKTLKEIDFH